MEVLSAENKLELAEDNGTEVLSLKLTGKNAASN